MPRLRQVARSDTDDRLVHAMYDLVFGEGVDPLDGTGTGTGTEGDWWTVFALVPDVLEHAVQGFVLYRSPERRIDEQLRELAQARVGWARGSAFVFSQHCIALRGLGVAYEKIAAIPWATAPDFSKLERAVLAYADAIVYDGGRVGDGVFEVLQRNLDDEAILELTYVTALYDMHATMARALRLEWDDRADPVTEVAAPEDFDAAAYVRLGANAEAKDQLKRLR
jgi:alkylhydroperoxidase family enzyme